MLSTLRGCKRSGHCIGKPSGSLQRVGPTLPAGGAAGGIGGGVAAVASELPSAGTGGAVDWHDAASKSATVGAVGWHDAASKSAMPDCEHPDHLRRVWAARSRLGSADFLSSVSARVSGCAGSCDFLTTDSAAFTSEASSTDTTRQPIRPVSGPGSAEKQISSDSEIVEGLSGLEQRSCDGGASWEDIVSASLQKTELSVMSWNVLARQYTRHNRQYHRAGPGVEDPLQTCRRYKIAGDEIVNRSCDVVLLQECEAAFFSADWNLAARELLSKYTVFRCPHSEASPGTAVLVKRDGRAVAEASRPQCIGGISEVGGPGKVATIVPMRVASRSFVAISTHFTFSGNAEGRLHHANLIGEAVRGRSVVLGGDFNCVPGAQLEALESSTFLGSLLRAPVDTATGLTSDFTREVCIDHFYISEDLGKARAVALAEPSNPWGGNASHPAEVTGASDHVPIMVHVALSEELADGGYGDQHPAGMTLVTRHLQPDSGK